MEIHENFTKHSMCTKKLFWKLFASIFKLEFFVNKSFFSNKLENFLSIRSTKEQWYGKFYIFMVVKIPKINRSKMFLVCWVDLSL